MGESFSSFELIGRGIVDLLLAGSAGVVRPAQGAHPWYVLTEVTGTGRTPGRWPSRSRVLGREPRRRA